MAVLPGLVAPELGFEIRRMLDAPIRFLLCMGDDNLGFVSSHDGDRFLPNAGSTGSPWRREAQVGARAGITLRDELYNLILEIRGKQLREIGC
jgi:hypothetical protein